MMPDGRTATPVTAQQYVYSLRRAVAPATASPYADIHSPIVNASAITDNKKPPDALGVKALDAHTLQIRLNKPTPFFLKTLAHPEQFSGVSARGEEMGRLVHPAGACGDQRRL